MIYLKSSKLEAHVRAPLALFFGDDVGGMSARLEEIVPAGSRGLIVSISSRDCHLAPPASGGAREIGEEDLRRRRGRKLRPPPLPGKAMKSGSRRSQTM